MEKKKPDHKSEDGRVKTAGWMNQFEDGNLGFSFEFKRSIRNGDDGWKDTKIMHLPDLLHLSKAALDAYDWAKRAGRSAKEVSPVE